LSLYLETAVKCADLYINTGIEPTTKLFFASYSRQPDGTYTPNDIQNFAEEERLYQSLILLTELTGNPKYANIGTEALNGLLTYACHPNTGLPPQGDSNYYQPIARTRTTNCTFTENLIPLIPIYTLNPSTLSLIESYYNYLTARGGTPGWVCDLVDITTGKCVGIHNFAQDATTVAEMMVEAYAATGDPKYLTRAEQIWQWFKTNRQGATGLFYTTTDAEGNHWFKGSSIYAWAYARALGYCLKNTDSPLILQCAKEHIDALIAYGWNIDGTKHWADIINADTGWADPTKPKMPMFAEYYQDWGPLELFRRTGNHEYLDVVLQNVPLDADISTFPTHNIPPIIELNIELYKITGDETRRNAAIRVADKLVNWIIANNYYIWGGLEGDIPYISIDNFWHSVLALLQLAKLETIPKHKITVQTTPIQGVTVKIDDWPAGPTPITTERVEGLHKIEVPSEVEA
jgi:hypothetical protein